MTLYLTHNGLYHKCMWEGLYAGYTLKGDYYYCFQENCNIKFPHFIALPFKSYSNYAKGSYIIGDTAYLVPSSIPKNCETIEINDSLFNS